MTSKIDKFLAKLDGGRREKILTVLLQIQTGNFENLDIKKLKGEVSRYRVRAGKCRIIFDGTQIGIKIVRIEFRNDTTYRP